MAVKGDHCSYCKQIVEYPCYNDSAYLKCSNLPPDTTLTNTPRAGESAEQTKARTDRGHNIRLERDALLVERQKTHGSFEINASASQQIKDIYNNYSYRNCKPIHREALDMIALKLSRILSGQANFKDHWDDIAGYAKLGSEACES